MQIRFAAPGDAAALLSIYAPYVEETAITFETAAPSEEAFRQRIDKTLQHYPYLVAEERGRVLGYAYAGRLRDRAAYDWDAELSVYLEQNVRGRGVGTALYLCLLDLLALQGVRWAYGVVTMPNEASHRLHMGLGFRLAATFPEMGYKHGRWWDVNWYLKELAPRREHPAPIVPLSGTAPQVQEILTSHAL